jgi:hypothetical protein
MVFNYTFFGNKLSVHTNKILLLFYAISFFIINIYSFNSIYVKAFRMVRNIQAALKC